MCINVEANDVEYRDLAISKLSEVINAAISWVGNEFFGEFK